MPRDFAAEAAEPSTVKVVVNTRQDALYFSRSPIPYPRNAEKARYLKHVGIYAYRRDVLQNYSQLPESMPEQAESLEQLRLMNAGSTSAHLRLPQPVRASTPQHAWKKCAP